MAYLYENGAFPVGLIVKFENGIRTDISWRNLQWTNPKNRSQRDKVARKNNISTGLLGVTFNKRMQRYVSQIVVNGRHRLIGVFDTAEEAHRAYAAVKLIEHGTRITGIDAAAIGESLP